MQKFYKEKAGKFLYDGNMIKPVKIIVPTQSFPMDTGCNAELPCIYTSAWEKDGEKAQIFVNHTDSEITFDFDGKAITVAPLSAEIVNI